MTVSNNSATKLPTIGNFVRSLVVALAFHLVIVGGAEAKAKTKHQVQSKAAELAVIAQKGIKGLKGKAAYYDVVHLSHSGKTAKVLSKRIKAAGTMVAAHKYLPLGTKVMVKDTKTNRRVTVTIVDRGPFSSGFVIDLSKEAAKVLLVDLDKGISNVELTVLN